MNSDQRLTMLVALLGGLALGAAIAGGMRRTSRLSRHAHDHHHMKHEEDKWEGEGGNIPSVPTPKPSEAVAY